MLLILTTIILTMLAQPAWAQSLQDQFEKQNNDLVLALNAQIKDSRFAELVDVSWESFEKYVLNFRNDAYGEIYTIDVSWMRDRITKKFTVKPAQQFLKCADIPAFEGWADKLFFTDGKYLASYTSRFKLGQKNNGISVQRSGWGEGVVVFKKIGEVQRRQLIKSKCEDVYIELINPLMKYSDVTDQIEEPFFFKAVDGYVYKNGGGVLEPGLVIGWKKHAAFVWGFVKSQCGQVEMLSQKNAISRTDEARKIKSKILSKIRQHNDYFLWAFKKRFPTQYKRELKNFCVELR